MNFENREEKINLALKLIDKLKKNDFNEYWTGFNQVPLALYDKENVYLINHPTPPKSFEPSKDGFYIGKWCDDYVGCTAIKINEIYCGIWNLDFLNEVVDIDQLYSSIVHEMFHANQLKNDEKRFANELDFINYPFTPEFINLRLNERQTLLTIPFQTDLSVKKALIAKFINIREQRESIIDDKIKYEYGVESIEGTATYVELHSLLKESKLPKPYLISTFGQKLLENIPLKNFRASCYITGAFLALILDEFFPNWKANYNNSNLYLYDFFKDCFKDLISVDQQKFIPENNFNYAKTIVSEYMKMKKHALEEFNNLEEYKIILKGNFKLTMFDPMNIIALNNKILHKNFIGCNNKIRIYDKVLSIHGGDLSNITELHFYSKEKPIVSSNILSLANLGDFSGDITISGKTYEINLENKETKNE